MRFLRLLFWLFLALLAALFMGRNWNDVTVDLWGNVQADIKLPLLVLIAFLFGYVPTTIRWRLRCWHLRKSARTTAAPVMPPIPPVAGETQP
jgi:putative membrane protein